VLPFEQFPEAFPDRLLDLADAVACHDYLLAGCHQRQEPVTDLANKQQITAIEDHARARGLKVPVLIDYIHVSGYIGKASAALHPGDPLAAGQWADGQLLRVLHGRAKAVAATLASVAAKTRANPRTRRMTGTPRNNTPLRKTHPSGPGPSG